MLLERTGHLASLGEHLASVLREARGRLIFLGGEAGVGKTALIDQFCAEQAHTVRRLSGACDALFTPRPLAPIVDLAHVLGGDLHVQVERGGQPYEITMALMRAVRTIGPSVLVLEDLQWVDEATLDVLRLLARRIDNVPTLVLASYRDDEVDRGHPLRVLLGELPSSDRIVRLHLSALSPEAVAELAEPFGVNAAELYRMTAGNAFFVTEALAAGDVRIPPTVRDAVLARAARLPPAAMGLLEAVAVVPPQAEAWLLEGLAPDDLAFVDTCVAAGMLAPLSGGVAFRHELARLSIEETLTPTRRLVLHRRALQALGNRPDGAVDLARLAHHAEGAADADAVQQYAPAAAVEAAALGAHREAAAQYARALRFAGGISPTRRAELLERQSHECYVTDQFEVSIAAGRAAVAAYREAGDLLREGDATRQLGYHLWCTSSTLEADQVARDAVELLEQVSPQPTRELALAYSTVAGLSMNLEDSEATAAFGTRALELAELLDDVEVRVDALDSLGTMELALGAASGRAKVQLAIELAHEAGLEHLLGRLAVNLCWAATRTRNYAGIQERIYSAREFCAERGFVLWDCYLLAYGAQIALDRGRWTEAQELAQELLRKPHTVLPRIPAMVVLGLLRARRGDPDAWPVLDEALARAEHAEALQFLGPVAAARAEASWLSGDQSGVLAATQKALELARQRGAAWVVGELACWRWRAGVAAAEPDRAAEPYALEMRGAWRQAAAFWRQRGCPYEECLALLGSDDVSALRRAVAELQRLGARAAAAVGARRLRELGAGGVPRGPRQQTRSNAAQLTARQLEILALLAAGMRNAEIASRLYLSSRTVDHHVSAILTKLDARSRTEATRVAARLGIVAPS